MLYYYCGACTCVSRLLLPSLSTEYSSLAGRPASLILICGENPPETIKIYNTTYGIKVVVGPFSLATACMYRNPLFVQFHTPVVCVFRTLFMVKRHPPSHGVFCNADTSWKVSAKTLYTSHSGRQKALCHAVVGVLQKKVVNILLLYSNSMGNYATQ